MMQNNNLLVAALREMRAARELPEPSGEAVRAAQVALEWRQNRWMVVFERLGVIRRRIAE